MLKFAVLIGTLVAVLVALEAYRMHQMYTQPSHVGQEFITPSDGLILPGSSDTFDRVMIDALPDLVRGKSEREKWDFLARAAASNHLFLAFPGDRLRVTKEIGKDCAVENLTRPEMGPNGWIPTEKLIASPLAAPSARQPE